MESQSDDDLRQEVSTAKTHAPVPLYNVNEREEQFNQQVSPQLIQKEHHEASFQHEESKEPANFGVTQSVQNSEQVLVNAQAQIGVFHNTTKAVLQEMSGIVSQTLNSSIQQNIVMEQTFSGFFKETENQTLIGVDMQEKLLALIDQSSVKQQLKQNFQNKMAALMYKQ